MKTDRLNCRWTREPARVLGQFMAPLPWIGAAKGLTVVSARPKTFHRRGRPRWSLESPRRTPVRQPPTHLRAVRRVVVTEEALQGWLLVEGSGQRTPKTPATRNTDQSSEAR